MRTLKYILILASPLVMAVTGCDKLKDFGDTNVNPGATTEANIGALLTNVESQLGGYAAFTRGGLYAQYLSQTQYTDESTYSLPQLNFNGEYAGILYDLQNIINLNQSNNQSVVAKILQQYLFWTITDRWGDVPYSEALTGEATPKYDKQEDIYKGMISALTAAIGQFDNSSNITGDVIYGGDVTKWKKLANSLRMMMALRLSERFPSPSGYAATEFKAALNDPAGYISSNADNFTLDYPGGTYRNAWYEVYNGRKDYGESATMTNLMSSLSDGRQEVFGGSSELVGEKDPSNVGVPYGWTKGKVEAWTASNPTWARVLRGDVREEGDPVVILGAAHVTLARAEAADYGWTSENPSTLLQQGVTQSFEQWGLAAPPASYFTQSAVALTAPAGTGANLQKIAIQRYIATYPDGLQGWSIWRKTGYPALTPAPDATNSSKQIPRRYTYGQNEYGTNPDETKVAADGISGGDTQDSRVWWDVQ